LANQTLGRALTRAGFSLAVAATAGLLALGALPANAIPQEPDSADVALEVVRPISVDPNGRLARNKKADTRFSDKAERALQVARSLRGARYRLGGTTPEGFDCSGYVGYVMGKIGITNIPRDSHSMFKAVPAIDRKDAQPGDLVFFHGKSGSVGHVGIFAGGNSMWHAPQSGRAVGLNPIYSSNVTFGRVINTE